jgi:MFS family permease
VAVIIESDIIYPAGAADEYGRKFFDVYRELIQRKIPIFAVPGNHDWDDGSLSGFMATFCGDERPASVTTAREEALGSWLARRLWGDRERTVSPPASPVGGTWQPGPYLALRIGGVLFIGIDTGYGSTIDADQARWLAEVVDNNPATPKILFSGKPLIVNGKRAPCAFEPSTSGDPTIVIGESGRAYGSVDDLVRDPHNDFVAVLGGDVHNYQRYIAHITDADGTRKLPYIVCGGGGVFIGQTAWLPKVDINDRVDGGAVHADEPETVLFPTRAHSRLYLEAIIRQSARRVRLTLPIVLLLTGLGWIVLYLVHTPAPNPGAGFGILATAIATNMSTRPTSRRGRTASFAISAAGGALAALGAYIAAHPRYGSRAEQTVGIAIGFIALHMLLQVAEASPFSTSRGMRWIGTALSALAGASLLALSLFAGFAAAEQSHAADLAVLIPALIGIAVVLALLGFLITGVTAEGAFNDEARVLSGETAMTAPRRRRFATWFATNQRRFSIFETFTGGRAHQHAWLTSDELVLGLVKRRRRVFLPLSLLSGNRIQADGGRRGLRLRIHRARGDRRAHGRQLVGRRDP